MADELRPGEADSGKPEGERAEVGRPAGEAGGFRRRNPPPHIPGRPVPPGPRARPGTAVAAVGHGAPRDGGRTRRGLLAATAATGLGLLAACAPDHADAHTAGSPTGDGATAAPGGKGSGASTPDGKGATPAPSGRGGRPTAPSTRPTRRSVELPRGGVELFPRYRLMGFCGLPGATALGRLGTGSPDERAQEIEKRARSYGDGREPLPVLELLATVANAGPGPDGTYRTRTSPDTIDRYHDVARRHRAMLLLNIQPGRASVLDEVKALRRWLKHGDVGVALDPEWEMSAGQIPGQSYGHTSGGELTDVASYLSGLVRAHDLPEKPLVFHQVASSVVRDQGSFRPQPGVAVIKSADGIGSPGLKRTTWRQLVRGMPEGFHTGFKLFFDEDTRGGTTLMTPHDVLALTPRPEYVMYE